MRKSECQIHSLPLMSEPMSSVDMVWQKRNRLKRILKRRMRYLLNAVSAIASTASKADAAAESRTTAAAAPLQSGDMVRVRSKDEIQKTLNNWNQLNRCSFMEEMWPHCGTTRRVLKRVERFLDERDYLIKKCKGILILDNVLCQGTKDFGSCDRACFFFWREEWLEKVGDNKESPAPPARAAG
jgi:hypothetical protein